MQNNNLTKELFSNIKTTGALTFSSSFLVDKMLSQVDFSNAKFLVELGGGNGVITHQILKRMRPDAKLVVFEVNKTFCDILDRINDPRIQVVCDSAEILPDVLAQNAGAADAIISSLPFSLIPKPVRINIYKACTKGIGEKGTFVQIAYSIFLRGEFKQHFGKVKTGFTLLNLPPAFVYTCINQ